jgi:hypothetical protein
MNSPNPERIDYHLTMIDRPIPTVPLQVIAFLYPRDTNKARILGHVKLVSPLVTLPLLPMVPLETVPLTFLLF